jgi:hypothetical protein
VKRNGSNSQQWLKEHINDNKIECARRGLARRKCYGWVGGDINVVESKRLSEWSRAELVSVCVCVSVSLCVCESVCMYVCV